MGLYTYHQYLMDLSEKTLILILGILYGLRWNETAWN
jgi:hypothetical protein